MKDTRFTHVIDWDKVQTVEDIKTILQSFNIKLDPNNLNSKMLKFSKPIDETKNITNNEIVKKAF